MDKKNVDFGGRLALAGNVTKIELPLSPSAPPPQLICRKSTKLVNFDSSTDSSIGCCQNHQLYQNRFKNVVEN